MGTSAWWPQGTWAHMWQGWAGDLLGMDPPWGPLTGMPGQRRGRAMGTEGLGAGGDVPAGVPWDRQLRWGRHSILYCLCLCLTGDCHSRGTGFAHGVPGQAGEAEVLKGLGETLSARGCMARGTLGRGGG